MQMTRRNTLVYTLIGIVFGVIFPVVGTLLEMVFRDLPITWENIQIVQRQTQLLWIIDTAPIFLGALAGIAGYRQDQVEILQKNAEVAFQEEKRLRSDLDSLNQELEQRVEDRTQDLEKRSQYIAAAAEIGRAATSIYKLDELFPRIVDLISEKFGFYQVGIFTIDNQNEYALLRAASSDGGKRMLTRSHKLKVGEEGIVGYVTNTGQARIALDVGEDAVHFNTPELPQTRSEMALPLYYGGRVFGALDVQSTQQNAFSEDDISALSVLADQVSMAINNATLFEELQTSVEAERKVYGEITRSAWREFLSQQDSMGYKYANQRVSPADVEWPEDMQAAFDQNQVVHNPSNHLSLAIPITISGEPVGVIHASKAQDTIEWTKDEIDLMKTLTNRVGEALESARLFQATQKQAVQEQLTSDISAQMRQTLDIDTVLKTAAKQLGDAFNAKEVVIRMAPDERR